LGISGITGAGAPPPGARSFMRSTFLLGTIGFCTRGPDIRTPLGYGNWLGLPEVSVPAGIGTDGLPALSLSVVGLPGEDARVLALAHAYERQSRRFVAPAAL